MRHLGFGRPRSARTRRLLRWGVAGAVALSLIGGGANLWVSGAITEAWATMTTQTHGAIAEAGASLGLRLYQITVAGRNHTNAADILAALDIAQGAPLLLLDPETARERLESLPWVKSASIERRLPSSVHITLAERTPIALWQHGQNYSLVDADGVVISGDISGFETLPLVVGDGAAEAASDLFTLLAAQPTLQTRVKAAVRVGKRRWDLWIDAIGQDGLEIRLPENASADSLTRLIDLDRKESLLSRDVTMIDLRLPDRLVVKPAETPAETDGKGPGGKPLGKAKNGKQTGKPDVVLPLGTGQEA